MRSNWWILMQSAKSVDVESERQQVTVAMQRSYSDIMIQSDRVMGSTPPKKEWCQRFTSFRQKPGRGAKDPVGRDNPYFSGFLANLFCWSGDPISPWGILSNAQELPSLLQSLATVARSTLS